MTTLTENLANLKIHMETTEKELASLVAGRKASSARARKALQNLKALAHTMRKQIVEHMKSLPVKSKPKKVAEVVGPVEPEEAEAPKKKKRVRKTP
jgi:hypothetical protein